MNWDAISAISQLIGSLAVVLSVLYLAVQVHQSTRVAKVAMQDAAATFETIHFHHVYGMMDRDLWEGWHGLLRHYVVAPGMAHYWKLRPEVFSERFRNFVNSLEPPADQRTVGTLFGEQRK